jgi:Zn-dependent protease with chaperone function
VIQTKSEHIQGFLKSFKIGFKGRLLICFALVVSVNLFNAFSSPLVRLAATITIMITAEFLVFCYVPFYLDNLRLMLKRKKIEVPLPDEIAALAKNMGLEISKMTIFPDVCNAYANRNKLFMGQKLLEKLNAEQIKAIAAHEFGHIKGRHTLAQLLYVLPITLCLCLSWSKLPPAILEIGFIAYIMLALVPLHWMIEKKADQAAAKYVGKEQFKSALLAIVEKEKINEPSETHPPISQRLKWIDEIKLTH